MCLTNVGTKVGANREVEREGPNSFTHFSFLAEVLSMFLLLQITKSCSNTYKRWSTTCSTNWPTYSKKKNSATSNTGFETKLCNWRSNAVNPSRRSKKRGDRSSSILYEGCRGGDRFQRYRRKTLLTLFGRARLRRTYYYCRESGTGHFPSDRSP